MPKKKPNFIETPKTVCGTCDGRGEVKDQYIERIFASNYWTYKKCTVCNGTGEIKVYCIECRELLSQGYRKEYCVNLNCKRVGLLTVIIGNNAKD